MAATRFASKAKVYRELGPSPWAISLAAGVYFLGALAIETIDTTYLLLAWLMAGLLAVSLYAARKGHSVNIGTVIFAVIVASCVATYFLHR